MPYLVNHPARFRRVLQLHRVADPPQPEAADHGTLLTVEPHRADHQRHLDRGAFCICSLIRHLFPIAGLKTYPTTVVAQDISPAFMPSPAPDPRCPCRAAAPAARDP